MELAERRVVVTGGAGFIGSHVVDRLTAGGAETIAIDDLSVGSRDNLAEAEAAGARVVIADVRDHERMESELAGADVVIHMACDNLRASLGRPLHTHEVNATGTLTAALAAAKVGVRRFVYVSSSEAYGTARTAQMAESHPLEPTTVYGASKAAGELYAQACMRTYGIEATIVRPFNAYGPREHAAGTSAEVIPKFVSRIRAGLAPVIFGDGSQTRDFTWVEETAEGIVRASACDELVGQAVNIARGEEVSIGEVAELLLEIMSAGSLQPERDEPRPGDVERHLADTRKAREVLGFTATIPIREGLERYVAGIERMPAQPAPETATAARNW